MKKVLNEIVGLAKWLPLCLPYRLSVLLNLPARMQVALMPPTRKPFIVKVAVSRVVLETKDKHRFPHLRFCWPGDWDREFTRPICSLDEPNDKSSPFHQDFETIRQVCRDGELLRDVEEYRLMLVAVRRGENPRGCSTQDDVACYFDTLCRVSASIQSEGYKTSAELGGLERDEVSVWITRYGDFVYGGWANHRLALAMLHGIDQLPVSILGAHPEWLERVCLQMSLPPHQALRQWAEQL